jgi:ankyrin repeat protein
MAFKCKIGLHSWNECKCSDCGKTRNNKHDYSKDCEKCSKCGNTRDNQHNWNNDCEKCSKCGKVRVNIDARINCKCLKCSNPVGSFFFDCDNGSIDKVKAFVNTPKGQSFDFNTTNGFNRTALHLAARNGNLEIVKLLLDKNAKIDIEDKDGLTAIQSIFMSTNPNMEIFKVLFDLGTTSIDDVKKMASIYNAARYDHFETLKMLLEYGLGNINGQDREGWSPLHWASANNNFPIAQLLLNNGCKIDIKEKDGVTSLYIASGRGHNNIVKLLLDKGAEINMQNDYGVFPLYQAAREGHLETVKLLIDNGANINLQDVEGWSSLRVASKRNHSEIVELLLEKGAKTT